MAPAFLSEEAFSRSGLGLAWAGSGTGPLFLPRSLCGQRPGPVQEACTPLPTHGGSPCQHLPALAGVLSLPCVCFLPQGEGGAGGGGPSEPGGGWAAPANRPLATPAAFSRFTFSRHEGLRLWIFILPVVPITSPSTLAARGVRQPGLRGNAAPPPLRWALGDQRHRTDQQLQINQARPGTGLGHAAPVTWWGCVRRGAREGWKLESD